MTFIRDQFFAVMNLLQTSHRNFRLRLFRRNRFNQNASAPVVVVTHGTLNYIMALLTICSRYEARVLGKPVCRISLRQCGESHRALLIKMRRRFGCYQCLGLLLLLGLVFRFDNLRRLKFAAFFPDFYKQIRRARQEVCWSVLYIEIPNL